MTRFPGWYRNSGEKTMRLLPLTFMILTPAGAQTRPDWTLIPESESVLEDRSWGCLGMADGGGGVRLASASGFVGRVNIHGPRLIATGDFSLITRFSNSSGAGGWVEAVGNPGTDPSTFWRNLKKVDFGVQGGNANLIVWNGEQSTPVINRSYPMGAAGDGDVALELARIGNELGLYSEGREIGRVPDPGVFASNEIRFGLLVAQGNEITLKSLLAATRAGEETTARVWRFEARAVPRSGGGLRDLPGARNLLIGASVTTSGLEKETAYHTLAREFNVTVAGNAMKWETVQPEPGRFAFCEADRLVAFAEANDQRVRGHVLVWGLQLPAWVERGSWSRETLLAAMRAHIQALAGRYRGRIFAWDVVNEALDDAPPHGLKPNVFTRVIGQDYLDFAFRYAREADPGAKLFYNDYGAERMNSKAQAVFNLVGAMKARGVPVDGVGLQMHYGLTGTMPAAEVEQNIRRLGQAGFEVHVTEMDITARLPDTPALQVEQAEIYRGLLGACRATPYCTAFVTWGIDESNSWILTFRPGNFGGLLFDANAWRKPAYYAVQQELGGRRAPAPAIAAGGVVNAASYSADPAFSAGSFFSVFGTDFSSRVTDWSQEFRGGRAPTVLDGVRVLVDGEPAFLALVAPGQINAIAPAGVGAGVRQVIVERNAQPSAPAAVRAEAVSPGLFAFSPAESRYAAALSADGAALIAPANLFGGAVDGRAVRPARPGERLLLFGSGFGATSPATGIGHAPGSAAALSQPVRVDVGGVAAEVEYAGRTAFPGLFQFNIRMPDLADGDHELMVTVGGVAARRRMIAVRRE